MEVIDKTGRDEAALEEFLNQIVDTYPEYILPLVERDGITQRQLRASVRVLIRREQHGDAGAGRSLDVLEQLMRERQGRPLESVPDDIYYSEAYEDNDHD